MGNSDFNDMSESLLKLQYKDRILQEYFFVMLYKDLVERAGYADSCDAGLEMDVGVRVSYQLRHPIAFHIHPRHHLGCRAHLFNRQGMLNTIEQL